MNNNLNTLIETAIQNQMIICLTGPTAAGKTSLAMTLSDSLPVEIISVDSALIYRQMNIGTAKPSKSELSLYPHHLVDICDPTQTYSTARFVEQTTSLINEIHQRNKLPLLVGGTMLYFRALLFGISDLPKANEQIRQQLSEQAAEFGWIYLHEQLKQIDPVASKRIHPNDPQRIQRALEVFHITGKSLTQLQQESQPQQPPWPSLSVAIAPSSREVLRERIAQRFHIMLEQGFEEEVKMLKHQYNLNLNMPSMRCVGYRQMWQYQEKELDYQEMIFRGITATRQLAKRQMTWLRSWPDLNWLETDDPDIFGKFMVIFHSKLTQNPI